MTTEADTLVMRIMDSTGSDSLIPAAEVPFIVAAGSQPALTPVFPRRRAAVTVALPTRFAEWAAHDWRGSRISTTHRGSQNCAC